MKMIELKFVEISPTNRARCVACQKVIRKGTIRLQIENNLGGHYYYGMCCADRIFPFIEKEIRMYLQTLSRAKRKYKKLKESIEVKKTLMLLELENEKRS